MVYIIATLLRKAFQQKASSWRDLMLMPADYDRAALDDPLTRSLMRRIEFRHGGPEYDAKYPNGIPTTLEITHAELGPLSSGLVMFPRGHARNASGDVDSLLEHKFRLLAGLAVDDVEAFGRRFEGLRRKGAEEIASLYDFRIRGVDHGP
jgi:2-methylcitrate dehydratase